MTFFISGLYSRMRVGEVVLDAKQVGTDASFCVRRPPLFGTLGHPNLFSLHCDDDIAVLYFCQPTAAFFNIQSAIILVRDHFVHDPRAPQRIAELEETLMQVNRNFVFSSINDNCTPRGNRLFSIYDHQFYNFYP